MLPCIMPEESRSSEPSGGSRVWRRGVDRGRSDPKGVAEVVEYRIFWLAVHPVSDRDHHSRAEKIFCHLSIRPKDLGEFLG